MKKYIRISGCSDRDRAISRKYVEITIGENNEYL